MSRGTILFHAARPHIVVLLESNHSSTDDFVPFLRGSQEDPATVGEVGAPRPAQGARHQQRC